MIYDLLPPCLIKKFKSIVYLDGNMYYLGCLEPNSFITSSNGYKLISILISFMHYLQTIFYSCLLYSIDNLVCYYHMSINEPFKVFYYHHDPPSSHHQACFKRVIPIIITV